MKALEFIYRESEIHFLVNPSEKNVMINATEMAKAFEKRIDHFLKAEHTKAFIEALYLKENGVDLASEFTPNGGNSANKNLDRIIQTKGQNGSFFHRALALKFAAWLDPEFEVWIYTKIEELVFGNYKRHWDAHCRQEAAKQTMQELRPRLLANPTPELAQQYFEAERDCINAKNQKSNAIRYQLRLFNEPDRN